MSSDAVTHELKECTDVQKVLNTLVEERDLIRDIPNKINSLEKRLQSKITEEAERGQRGFEEVGGAINHINEKVNNQDRRIDSQDRRMSGFDQRLNLLEALSTNTKISVDTNTEISKQTLTLVKTVSEVVANSGNLKQSTKQNNKFISSIPVAGWIVGGVVVVAIVAMLTDHSDDFMKWISLFKDTQVTK